MIDNPPPSSKVRTKIESFHALLAISASMTDFTPVAPFWMLLSGCSSVCFTTLNKDHRRQLRIGIRLREQR